MNAATPILHQLDVRGLEPPEPMERVLEALDSLPDGDHLCMLIEREPRPLYRILAHNGYGYNTTVLPDFLYQVRIWRRAPEPDA
ncbi:DUF2249 domain-containing protein [Massilia sp. CCM 8695]|uniref:DUF2249 domain-containing protein n=1 Tax=Massilia frigida TaxID=2609281 RepID=A0ABX0NHL3_9BURK|nr:MULTISPECIES: DUF2249 domain-containing protein [Massilia]MDM5180135.1 DUF2249 domain-containing protein [Massilia sp. DJPM01]NHZ81740.1 DUF2249 domain-containing protein [Massilia frigida]